MKCVKHTGTGDVWRVKNRTAQLLVNEPGDRFGKYIFASRSEWKKKGHHYRDLWF